ncbi:MAG: hypothetical protein AAF911_04265 [Planctomycetota bacterium]
MRTQRSGKKTASAMFVAWLGLNVLTVVLVSTLAAAQAAETSLDFDQASKETAPGIKADEATTRAAIQLFNDAVTVQANGKHNRLLRALRHLEAPALGPLFVELSRASHPSLQVHGLLGVAELNQPRGLIASDIAAVARPDVQAELISAALDGDLIDEPTRAALLSWHSLPPGVKLLLATPQVAAGEYDYNSPGYEHLFAAMDDDTLGRRGLSAMLLNQLGEDQGRQTLESITDSTHPSSDAVRATLLETAWTHGLNGSAAWAYDVATRPGTPPRLEMLALKVAIRFGDGRGDARWTQRFESGEDISLRTRLAWVGLEVAPWLSPERFAPLIKSDDPLIAQLGLTAQAVAQSRPGHGQHPAVEAHAVALIETNHPQAARWAAEYASETGSAALAAAVVMKTDPGEPRGRARRLDAVVRSTQTLIQLEPEMAERLLVAALQSEDVDPAWQRGVLLGLIRSRSDAAREIGDQLPPFTDRNTEALALVLRLQNPAPLNETQAEDLSLVLRGGADLDDSLRVQMAWAYLYRTGQGAEAIAAVLAEP